MEKLVYQGVLVVCETRENGVAGASMELLSEGRRLADARGTALYALLVGDGLETIARIPGGYGANRVLLYDAPAYACYQTEAFASAVCTAVREYRPEIVLMSATEIGRDLAPRCAARLHTGLCADCVRLDIDTDAYRAYLTENATLDLAKVELDPNDTDLKMTRPAFGGHLMASIVCRRFRPVMATVRPGVMQRSAFNAAGAAAVEIIRMPFVAETTENPVLLLERVLGKATTGDVTQAKCIVAVGRGIAKDVQRGMALAGELAEALGGTIAGSRVAIDAGWLDKDKQIGQTGRTVRPDVYVAVGISGAIQHLAGMQDAGFILSINKDADAPVIGVSDCALIGDLYQVLPTLIREIKSRKADN